MSTWRASILRAVDVGKDLTCFALGLLIIYRQGWQVSKEEFNWVALAFGVGLTQAPGAMAVISLLRTGGPSSAVAPSVASARSLSSSPSVQEDEPG